MTNYFLSWELTKRLEAPDGVAVLKAYVPEESPGVADKNSGVTMGWGVDLRWVSQKFLSHVRNKDEALFSALEKLHGLEGQMAQDKLAENPLTITESQAQLMFDVKIPSIMPAIMRAFDDDANGRYVWGDLVAEPKVASVIASVAWQYGPNMPKRCPRFWRACVEWEVRDMIAELLNFKDKYPTRRFKEAFYLWHGKFPWPEKSPQAIKTLRASAGLDG